nr:hypothetical protein Iba_chr12aCG17740 [Ipomoea batatas]GMD63225.1 hypothetical protein Iba_scaffold49110CG0010 [Ipomoea batatas]GMD69126.1 hypothetical protein Iba_chr12dCG15930 [Ipomoea batatas]GMD73136.1 hypothetical protein Iba_chr12fCG15420 [Ipomoea batatas]
MRIKAMIIARTMSFTFIFFSHIFLLILVPCVLKSCACERRFSVLSTRISIFSPRSRTYKMFSIITPLTSET